MNFVATVMMLAAAAFAYEDCSIYNGERYHFCKKHNELEDELNE